MPFICTGCPVLGTLPAARHNLSLLIHTVNGSLVSANAFTSRQYRLRACAFLDPVVLLSHCGTI